jgi:hypothetical protein
MVDASLIEKRKAKVKALRHFSIAITLCDAYNWKPEELIMFIKEERTK